MKLCVGGVSGGGGGGGSSCDGLLMLAIRRTRRTREHQKAEGRARKRVYTAA